MWWLQVNLNGEIHDKRLILSEGEIMIIEFATEEKEIAFSNML
jgi:hypothetical protein